VSKEDMISHQYMVTFKGKEQVDLFWSASSKAKEDRCPLRVIILDALDEYLNGRITKIF
jgi:hypothetical protein